MLNVTGHGPLIRLIWCFCGDIPSRGLVKIYHFVPLPLSAVVLLVADKVVICISDGDVNDSDVETTHVRSKRQRPQGKLGIRGFRWISIFSHADFIDVDN